MLSCVAALHIWEHHASIAPVSGSLTLLVYVLAWIVLFGTSTLYHASRHMGRKMTLRMLDHCAIFLVIAASYGPFVLYALNDSKGHVIWLVSWLIALGGCLFKFRSEYRYHAQSTWAYILQGWMVMLSFPTLWSALSPQAMAWLALGGVSLTGGTYFYIKDEVKYNHCIWHLCVLLGSYGFYKSILDIIS